MASQTLTIRKPDDWHVHLRDGEMLQRVGPYTARQFGRAIVMPNLVPPVTSVEAAREYRKRIMAATVPGFTPLMTCYLTDQSSPDEIARGHAEGVWIAAKLYPAGATTNSASGVTDIRNIYPALTRMEQIGMVLCVHGEVTDPDVDVFDREKIFIDRVLTRLVNDFPGLKIVLEHITTNDAADFVLQGGRTWRRPSPPASGDQPQCPVRRRAAAACLLPAGRQARGTSAGRARAATSGAPNFFLGTDSAPHSREAKESACGCAGIFNAPFALESYATVFEEEGALDRFEAFASVNGARFYGLPLNEETVTLERMATHVPETVVGLVPFQAGEMLPWSLLT